MTKIYRSLKNFWLAFLRRSLEADSMNIWFSKNFPDTGSSRKIENFSNPYKPNLEKKTSRPIEPIFITGRFRSGSTLLWNIFRNLDGYTAFYEPFNERRWFDRTFRGDRLDQTHKGVSDYWSEYKGLDSLAKYYREDWTRKHLYMDKTDYDYAMNDFIHVLLEASACRPVLQFNRVDFRLDWLKCQFPSSKIVHIYRNPRDQWCSTLRSDESYSKSSSGGRGFIDHFYLNQWCQDLIKQFPFLKFYDNHHRYFQFYLIWKLSYCYGRHFGDISVSLEELSENPKSEIENVLRVIGTDTKVYQSQFPFIEEVTSRWEMYADDSWFSSIEEECNQVVDDFLIGDSK